MKAIDLSELALVVGGARRAAKPVFSCVKPDGDWLDGVSRRQCLSRGIRGSWERQS